MMPTLFGTFYTLYGAFLTVVVAQYHSSLG
nr:MAG TPA: hypothetical protein [Caudoviricetes sp.]